ncbi:MAG: MFS transporter, partial [Actinomycetota bacterium]|nr:MFS transporter [Actinomycetota bacterium]
MRRLRRAGTRLTTTTAPSRTLVRDRLTWSVYALLAVYGYFLYGFGPSVDLLGAEQDVPRSVSALHSTALAVGAVVAGLAGARVTRQVGRKPVLLGGAVALCVAAALYCSTTLLPVTLFAALLAGTAGSAVVNAHSAVLAQHHGDAGPAAISEANALASASGLFGPLAVGTAVSIGLGWRAGILVTLLLAALALLLARPVAVPAAPTVAEGARLAGPLPAAYWAAWVVLVLSIAVEFCLAFWAAELLQSRAGVPAGRATAAVTALVLGMAVGRFLGGRLALTRPPDRLLLQAILLTGLGFAVFWLGSSPVVSIGGLFLSGTGMALHFPLGIARALAASDGRLDQAAARASLGAGLAIGVAPWALGAVADAVGPHLAFLLVPLFLT